MRAEHYHFLIVGMEAEAKRQETLMNASFPIMSSEYLHYRENFIIIITRLALAKNYRKHFIRMVELTHQERS